MHAAAQAAAALGRSQALDQGAVDRELLLAAIEAAAPALARLRVRDCLPPPHCACCRRGGCSWVLGGDGTAAYSVRHYITELVHAERCACAVQEVLWVMGARLAHIEEHWASGRLQRAGLGAREVAHLVEALFEDTEPRRALLQQLH